MNHLEHDSEYNVFSPDPKFSWVDERALGPIAFLVLDASKPYLQRYFATAPETNLLLERIDDLQDRLLKVGAAHEKFMAEGT